MDNAYPLDRKKIMEQKLRLLIPRDLEVSSKFHQEICQLVIFLTNSLVSHDFFAPMKTRDTLVN